MLRPIPKASATPLLVAVVALGLAACGGGSHPRSVRGAAPPPSAAELQKLAQLALDSARGAGDANPTDALVVRTTRKVAELVDTGSGVGFASTPAYFVVVHGTFKDCGVPLPSSAKCPTGTTITMTIDPQTNTSTDFGIQSGTPDVNKMGPSESLPLQTAG